MEVVCNISQRASLPVPVYDCFIVIDCKSDTVCFSPEEKNNKLFIIIMFLYIPDIERGLPFPTNASRY